ncbi:MAG: hypothetical protein K0R14_1780 [Burkholderiales bacterium]|nr:hypothetical protein [Burkholderiales bacterium]
MAKKNYLLLLLTASLTTAAFALPEKYDTLLKCHVAIEPIGTGINTTDATLMATTKIVGSEQTLRMDLILTKTDKTTTSFPVSQVRGIQTSAVSVSPTPKYYIGSIIGKPIVPATPDAREAYGDSWNWELKRVTTNKCETGWFQHTNDTVSFILTTTLDPSKYGSGGIELRCKEAKPVQGGDVEKLITGKSTNDYLEARPDYTFVKDIHEPVVCPDNTVWWYGSSV